MAGMTKEQWEFIKGGIEQIKKIDEKQDDLNEKYFELDKNVYSLTQAIKGNGVKGLKERVDEHDLKIETNEKNMNKHIIVDQEKKEKINEKKRDTKAIERRDNKKQLIVLIISVLSSGSFLFLLTKLFP